MRVEPFLLSLGEPMKREISLGLIVLVVGCGSVVDDARGDASTDVSSTDSTAETTPAPGGGVCCPLTATTGCSPSGYFGGWAASAADCKEQTAYDGCPFVKQTDSHGCAVIEEPACTNRCGAVVDTGAPDITTGGDIDAHGCIGSAGYQWCEKEMKCERPWELASAKGFPNTAAEFAKYCTG